MIYKKQYNLFCLKNAAFRTSVHHQVHEKYVHENNQKKKK